MLNKNKILAENTLQQAPTFSFFLLIEQLPDYNQAFWFTRLQRKYRCGYSGLWESCISHHKCISELFRVQTKSILSQDWGPDGVFSSGLLSGS